MVEGMKIVVERERGSTPLANVARNVCWKAVSQVDVDAKISLGNEYSRLAIPRGLKRSDTIGDTMTQMAVSSK